MILFLSSLIRNVSWCYKQKQFVTGFPLELEDEYVHVINSVYELLSRGSMFRMNLLTLLLFILINFVYFTIYIYES